MATRAKLADVMLPGFRGTAKYMCPKCKYTWKKKKSCGGPKNCPNKVRVDKGDGLKKQPCGERAIPYDFIPKSKRKRYFGRFQCSECNNEWPSGYTWLEWDEDTKTLNAVGQDCLKCSYGVDIYPYIVRPLQYSGERPSQKPHDTSACGMCKKLGGDCRKLAESNVAEDDNDTTSVFSEGSSFATEDREDPTPVPSDEEGLDEHLSQQVRNLKVSPDAGSCT